MNTKKLKRWLPLLIILTLMVVVFSTGLHNKISLKALQENKVAMLEAVAESPVTTALGFMALYIVFVALSLPAATLLTLAGGFLFGLWLGTLYVITAATIGATIIFLIAKTSLGSTLREKAGSFYQRIEKNMENNAVGYLLFMRLVPVFPFFMVNIAPALFNVKPRVFILTTFFGILPGTFVFVNLGTQLATITDPSDLVSLHTLLAFALLGFFALIPTLYQQFKNRKKTLSSIVLIGLLVVNPIYAAGEQQSFTELYDGLLSEYVSPIEIDGIVFNGVDYDGLGADHRYEKTLNALLAVSPDNYKNEEKTAFWINAYNFLTIELIIREQERESIKNLGGFFTSPWKKHSWSLAGNDYTLDEIEHEILRPMGDARVHFAINCASVSCPDLRQESYQADKLDEQLNEQVRLTLSNKGKGFYQENNELYVSKIFDWFAEDFNDGDVKTWLLDYQHINKNHALKFIKYDWSLNKAR